MLFFLKNHLQLRLLTFDSELHSKISFMYINDASLRFCPYSMIFSYLSFLFTHTHQLSEDIDRFSQRDGRQLYGLSA